MFFDNLSWCLEFSQNNVRIGNCENVTSTQQYSCWNYSTQVPQIIKGSPGMNRCSYRVHETVVLKMILRSNSLDCSLEANVLGRSHWNNGCYCSGNLRHLHTVHLPEEAHRDPRIIRVCTKSSFYLYISIPFSFQCSGVLLMRCIPKREVTPTM